MKKLFTRFTAIITTIAVAAASLCAATFALPSYDSWSANGYDGSTLNNLLTQNKIDYIKSNINPNWSDAQKAAYIYSYISNNYRHPEGMIDTNGEILFEQSGIGVCAEFATMFYKATNTIGMKSELVSLKESGIGHAADLINVSGIWYHIDCDKQSFLATRWTKGYAGPYDQENGQFTDLEEILGIRVTDSSDYSTSNYTYFEYNGQWYAYDSRWIYKIDSSLKNMSNASWERVFYLDVNKSVSEITYKERVKMNSNGNGWKPTSFAYDNNGKLYFDFFGDIYAYNAATNTSSFVISVGNNINGAVYSGNKIQQYGRTSYNSPIAWLGVDKYALYYVTRDGKFGSVSLNGNSSALETVKTSIAMRAGEAAYNTAVASTEYLCGYQLSYKSSDESIATVDKYGIVYAKKVGTAYITVSYMGRSADYKVTVKDMNYTGSVDSVPYVKLNTGNYYTDEVVNAYDPRLPGNSSSSVSTTEETVTPTVANNKTVYNVANSKVYLQLGIPVDAKYFADINDKTVITSSNNNRVKVTKTDTGYTITAKSGTGYVTIKNGTETNKIYVVACKKTTPPSYLKFMISTKKITVGKSFMVTALSNADASDELTWIFSNDNIKLSTELNDKGNTEIKFTALASGTTKIYCLTSSGYVKSFTVTVK